MKFEEKLQELRKGKGLSQEALAELLNVSRQAISRWESGLSYPETEKIITLSEIFGVTVDSLLKDGEVKYDKENIYYEPYWVARGRHYEYKSKRFLFGLPLVHINVGWGAKKAKGIIAIGNIATGFISIGFISTGLLAIGLLGTGIISLGILSVGLLFALGVISIGTFAIGAVSLGLVTLGAVSIGRYSVGAVAVASRIAVGDHAYGHIAVGRVAEGVRVFIENTPRQQTYNTSNIFSTVSREEVRKAIFQEFPNIKQWIVNFTTMFLR